MGGASARLRLTSLRQMAEQVASDEPDDARWMVDNMDRLRDRWARKNLDGKSGTARTYASRAKTTIEEYLRWAESPGTYDPKRSPTRAEKKPATQSKPAVEVPVSSSPVTHTPSATVSAASNADPALRIVDLDAGRQFRYFRPGDGLHVKDAIRVAFNLITNCDDFDTTTMTPVQVISAALQRTQ